MKIESTLPYRPSTPSMEIEKKKSSCDSDLSSSTFIRSSSERYRSLQSPLCRAVENGFGISLISAGRVDRHNRFSAHRTGCAWVSRVACSHGAMLEVNFSAELHVARRQTTPCCPESRARIVEIAVHSVQIDAIEQIEDVHTEFSVEPLGNGSPLSCG